MAAIYIDDQKVGLKKVFEELGIENNLPQNVRQRVFELRNIVKDKLNGGVRMPRSIGGVPEFVVFSKKHGHTVKIRYANSQTPRKDKDPLYQPILLSLIPNELGQVEIQDDVTFVFWYLHPLHEFSPFRDKKAGFDFKYLNKDGIAAQEVTKEEYTINALSIILGDKAWNTIRLRQFAKGLRMAGVDDLTDMELKKSLMDLAKKDPVGFYSKTQVSDYQFEGFIQDAIDKGILERKTINGLERWYLVGEEILPIQYGADAQKALSDYIALNTKELIPKIKNALVGETKSSVLNTPENKSLIMDLDTLAKVDTTLYEDQAHGKNVLKINDSVNRVDEDEPFRKRIAEQLVKRQNAADKGEKLHPQTEQWFVDNQDAITYYLENYSNKETEK
ncbi:hypothetical protein KO02_12265 [Sphingobacterium sp. ML3W]|uniref:hypothetical protein n=1 Tax=Sphingobacterium sp. ML3W TaxID=1538644 RepID=UPI0004F6A2A2|nr:hypothetical protein [Sphingobacterium sp. ML3W]AIM37379.1 hypothetical protein KO02_12265 [Sphingobacterium sp. ML3W]